MKKYLILLIVTFGLVLFTGYKVNANAKANETVSELNALVEAYYNDGVYTKDTEIFLNQEAVNELIENLGFHNNVDILVRRTFFTKDALWMSHGDQDTKYSYYGTLGSDMTGGVVDNVGDTVNTIAYRGKTMEEFYITMNDVVATADQNWTMENGVYTSSDVEVVEWFKAIAAPCYIGFQKDTENYISLSNVTIKEVNNTLELSLYTDNGDLSKLTSGSTLFAKAVIYAGRPSETYYLTNDTVASEGLNGEGTQENPFLINNDSDLLYFNNAVEDGNNYENLYVKLTANIDVAGYDNFMIGYYNASNDLRTFSGHLDGGNNTISGLNINNTVQADGTTPTYGTGFIACLGSGGSIKNLIVDGTVVGGENVAAIAGRCSGHIVNCVNNATVTGTNDVGGVAGYVFGTNNRITDCVNNGTITATAASNTQVGGVIGVSAGVITNCVNYGDVVGFHVVGGIASYFGNASSNNTNYGRIEGNNCVGGIAGIYGYSSHLEKQSYALSNCVNYGEVVGKKTYSTLRNIGGIAGWAYMNIEDCDNKGIITVDAGVYNAGGITGNIGGANAKIVNCSNEADIASGNGYGIGGIVGYTKVVCSILKCENTGNISGERIISGIIGNIEAKVTVEKCINRGTIDGTSHDIGGIVGATYGAAGGTAITECTNYGLITGANSGNKSSIGGIVGRTYEAKSSIVKVDSCENYGVVSSDLASHVGGVVGMLGSKASVVNSKNHNSVTGYANVGGINGSMYTNSHVNGCVNNGNVIAETTYVSGIAGYSKSNSTGSSITNCTNNGTISTKLTSGDAFAGSFIGGGSDTTYLTVSNNTNKGSLIIANGVTGWDEEFGGTTAEVNTNITFSNNTVN